MPEGLGDFFHLRGDGRSSGQPKGLVPYLSHNPASFWRYLRIESPDARGGRRDFLHSRGIGDLPWDRSPFPCGLKTSRDLQPIAVRDFRPVFGLYSRTSMRHAMLTDHLL